MKNKWPISTVKFTLEQQYNLICFEDLADYISKHRDMFDLFKTYHKSVFEPEQRLVLYTSHFLSQDFLNHIQHAAKKIDISNFFILIVNPEKLESKLFIANQLHGNDSTPIQCLQLNLDSSKTLPTPGFFKNHNVICPLPFTTVDINTLNIARPCCKFKGVPGNVQNNNIDEIFYSDYYESVRQRLASGEKIAECQTCWNDEKQNVISPRQYAMVQLGDKFEQKYFDQPGIQKVSLSFSNLCNFSCRICDYQKSSKIASEEYIHSTNIDDKKTFRHYLHLEKIKKHADKKILENIVDNLQNAEFVHIMGGEPFIWPFLPEFLDQIILRGYSQQMQLEFHTNGYKFPTSIVPKLKEFKSVEILLSIDDIEERFELQRGGNWSDILKNLELYKSLQDQNILVKIAPTVNIQNLLYLDELVSLINKFEFGTVWWYLEDPHFLCIDNTTQAVKELVYQKYKNHVNSELRAIANRVICSKPVSGTEFFEYMSKLDQRRNQNFGLAHKELFDAMSS